MDWAGKRYWLIGAADGLGAELAHVLSRMGVELAVSASTPEKLEELARAVPGRARAVSLDLAGSESVAAAACEVGEIDGLIYLASHNVEMSARSFSVDDGLRSIDVGLAGAVRVLGATLPPMLEAGKGHVVLGGDFSAYRGAPRALAHGAAKAGLANLAEGLYGELSENGVKMQLVLCGKNNPQRAARGVFEHMSGDGLRYVYPWACGIGARLGGLLPDALYHRAF